MNQSIKIRHIEEAYDAWGGAVYRLAMVYLGRHADAEDVTQEVFVRLLSRAPAFSDGEHEKRWLLRVTANLCRDQLRGFWRRRVTGLEDTLPCRPAPGAGGPGRCDGPAGAVQAAHPPPLL